MSTVLKVQNLRKVYPGRKAHVAVDDVSFDLKEGEILGLLGPNGSGKTTTIQMLLGTLSLTSGSISYFGKDFETHRTEVLQKVVFASTYTSLPYLLTISENLKVFGRLYDLTPKESEKLFDPLLERFGIADKKHTRVASLSAGQVTRLMLVKALFVEPKIVLLDEPTASLDPDIANEILEFLLHQREKTNLSILFTSHKMEEATALCDRAIFLKEGNIIANDKPRNLAKLASSFRLRMSLIDGMKRLMALCEKNHLHYKADHRSVEIILDEKNVPAFLNEVGKADITYEHLKLEEPSLEDYFLQISR